MLKTAIIGNKVHFNEFINKLMWKTNPLAFEVDTIILPMVSQGKQLDIRRALAALQKVCIREYQQL